MNSATKTESNKKESGFVWNGQYKFRADGRQAFKQIMVPFDRYKEFCEKLGIEHRNTEQFSRDMFKALGISWTPYPTESDYLTAQNTTTNQQQQPAVADTTNVNGLNGIETVLIDAIKQWINAKKTNIEILTAFVNSGWHQEKVTKVLNVLSPKQIDNTSIPLPLQ